MFFCKRNKPNHDETIYNGDEPVAKINLDGSGYANGGSTFFSFNLLGGSVDGDDLSMRGRRVNVSEKDGSQYIEVKK